jgi:hypothetical protein
MSVCKSAILRCFVRDHRHHPLGEAFEQLGICVALRFPALVMLLTLRLEGHSLLLFPFLNRFVPFRSPLVFRTVHGVFEHFFNEWHHFRTLQVQFLVQVVDMVDHDGKQTKIVRANLGDGFSKRHHILHGQVDADGGNGKDVAAPKGGFDMLNHLTHFWARARFADARGIHLCGEINAGTIAVRLDVLYVGRDASGAHLGFLLLLGVGSTCVFHSCRGGEFVKCQTRASSQCANDFLLSLTSKNEDDVDI